MEGNRCKLVGKGAWYQGFSSELMKSEDLSDMQMEKYNRDLPLVSVTEEQGWRDTFVSRYRNDISEP